MRFRICYMKKMIIIICCLAVITVHNSMYFMYEAFETSIEGIKQTITSYPKKVVFNDSQAKTILLLSYQRCGSSFTGELFNQNKDALYFFEPVDGIYNAMYGTQQGYAIPSDIFFNWNGSRRAIPEYEQQNVANSLRSFMECDFEAVPMEMLNHKYMVPAFYGKLKGNFHAYMTCLKDKNKCDCDPAKERCSKTLSFLCPTNFGANNPKHLQCYDALWNRHPNLSYFSNIDVDTFNFYDLCKRRVYNAMQQHCVPLLHKMCSETKIKAVKTVRLNMKTAEILVQKIPNLRIIHLIRDPRGVVLSRKRNPSYHGHYSGSDMVKEAELYCKQVVEDVQHRKVLEKKYPGASMQVIYEAFTMDPYKQAESMYNFLNESFPIGVKHWLKNNTRGLLKNSKAIAAKWQNKLTYINSKNIANVCSKFYKSVQFNWP